MDLIADGTPAIRYGEIYTRHSEVIDRLFSFVSPENAKKSVRLKNGDVLFARPGETAEEIGKCTAFISDAEVYAGDDVLIFSPRGVDSRYLSYTMNHHPDVVRERQRLAQGEMIVHTSPASLGQIEIPVPPIEEQKAIVRPLTESDALIAGIDALIAKNRAIKQGAMQQLLTGKSRLPGFKDDWKEQRLESLLTFVRHANNPHRDLRTEGIVQYIHYGDVHGINASSLDCATFNLPWIDKTKVEGIPRLADGDLILVDASEDLAGVGKSVELMNVGDRSIVAGLHTLVARGDSQHWAPGFKALLQFIPQFKQSLEKAATGISVYAISKAQVSRIALQLPPVDEQVAIVSILSDMEAEISALTQDRSKMRAIKQGMLQSLLRGCIPFTGPAETPSLSTGSSGTRAGA